MAYTIRELNIGEILDQGIAVIRNRFTTVFGILLVILVPLHLIQQFALLAVSPEVGYLPTPEQRQAVQEALPLIRTIQAIGGILLFVVVLPLTNAAIIHTISNEYLGHRVSMGDALRLALGLILPLLWVGILTGLAVMGGTILCVIPGIIVAFKLWFVNYVVVVENLRGVEALKRSWNLMKGNIATAFVLGIIIFVIQFAFGFVAGLIPVPVVSVLIIVLATAVSTLVQAAVGVVFYFSARCKHEHFDLKILAESIGAEGPGPGDDEPGPAAGATF